MNLRGGGVSNTRIGTDAAVSLTRKQNSMSIEETRIEEVEDDDDDLPELEDAPAGAEPAGGDDDVPAEMAGTRKNQSRAEKKARKVRPQRPLWTRRASRASSYVSCFAFRPSPSSDSRSSRASPVSPFAGPRTCVFCNLHRSWTRV